MKTGKKFNRNTEILLKNNISCKSRQLLLKIERSIEKSLIHRSCDTPKILNTVHQKSKTFQVKKKALKFKGKWKN